MSTKNGFTIYNDDAILLARLEPEVCADVILNVVDYAVYGVEIDINETTTEYNALVALASLCIINKIKRDRAGKEN